MAITKRAAALCATQAGLSSSGIELLAIPDLKAAMEAIRTLHAEAAIVCRHSWTEEERLRIAATVSEEHPEVKFVMRCPGCTETGEAPTAPGELTDPTLLVEMIAAIAPAAGEPHSPEAA